MRREELKQTLVEQFEPMSHAVQKKMTYLQSEDIFTDYMEDYSNQYSGMDILSVEDAFATFADSHSQHIEDIKPRALNDVSYKSASTIKVEQATPETIQSHKQNIAAKIAALRGISMPGDYLNKKW